MSKIIRAINVMISNSKKITNVILSEKEYFFLYDRKHKWSISKNEEKNVFYLHYYPGEETLEDLSSITPEDWDYHNISYITYSSEEIKTREAYESMQELYRITKEKSLGIDKVFDDIIDSDESEPPF